MWLPGRRRRGLLKSRDSHMSRSHRRIGCSLGIQGHRDNSKHRREKDSRDGSGVKRSRWSPAATDKLGSAKDVAHALVMRRSAPDRIVDRRGKDTSGTANRRNRRNHENLSMTLRMRRPRDALGQIV